MSRLARPEAPTKTQRPAVRPAMATPPASPKPQHGLFVEAVLWFLRKVKWTSINNGRRALRYVRLIGGLGRACTNCARIAAASCGATFKPRRRPRIAGKRILMLTISQIDIDPRINKVARSMAEAGYEVDILCGAPSNEPLRVEPVFPGVRYVRTPMLPRWARFWRIYQGEFRAVARAREYDYVHVNDLTTLWIGWILARDRGVPLVYDAHEMWSENVSWNGERYVGMKWWVRWPLHALERFLGRRADLFISVSPSICTEYKRIYKLPDEPVMIANFPEVRFAETGHGPSIRELCGLDERHFVTLYLGGINPARNIETVIRAHAHLPDDCVFVIRGPLIEYYENDYRRVAAEAGVSDRVYFLPPVGRDEVIGGMRGADCGVVMLKNLCKNFYWFYPNKFFEYMLGGLPVAVSNFPDVSAHIERERCGVTFDPESPESVAQALASLHNDRAAARAMGERGRQGVLREYNWEAANRRLLDEYAKLHSA